MRQDYLRPQDLEELSISGVGQEKVPIAWEKMNKPIKLLFVSDDPNVCSRFPNGKKTAVVYYTNCECDTGPSADGYCALTVVEVHEIPKKFKKYAR